MASTDDKGEAVGFFLGRGLLMEKDRRVRGSEGDEFMTLCASKRRLLRIDTCLAMRETNSFVHGLCFCKLGIRPILLRVYSSGLQSVCMHSYVCCSVEGSPAGFHTCYMWRLFWG